MARGEKLTDAIKYEKIDALKKDLFSYIETNSDKIDSNLPVFFGHVISALDNAFPDTDDAVYDDFIDAIAYHVMVISKKATSFDYIEKVSSNAMRAKKRTSGRATLKILTGIKLMTIKEYKTAIEYFSDYWKHDARIGFYIAYCHHHLSDKKEQQKAIRNGQKRSEHEFSAREMLLELARIQPPIYRLKQLDMVDSDDTDNAFWFMIKKALDWFSSERWFIRIGIEKAKKDDNEEKRVELLNIATVRFYNDLEFLRELYNLKLEKRDGLGASGVVKQMMQQYPDSLEPIYYGIKLSLLTTGKGSYTNFRDMAMEKGMPVYLIQLLDFAFFLMKGEKYEAFVHLKEMKRRFKSLHYYLITLEYLANEIFCEDEIRASQSKKTFFDSLDRYALQVIKVQE